MRTTVLQTALLTSFIWMTAASLIVPFLSHPQAEMDLGPVQPDAPASSSPPADSVLTISDVLPKTRAINIFASLCRDVSSIAGRLESTDATSNTTLLAPLNSAMQALPRKPWEDPPNDISGVSAQHSEDKAAANLQKFVEAHAVPVSPWRADDKIDTIGGARVWWERRDGKRFIMPGNIEVNGVVERVGNGEVWAIKGVVNYK